MNQKQDLGKLGEARAAEFLCGLGYQIIARNWRGTAGEIDIVARYRRQLVFVEVKTRSGHQFGHPFEAITAKKVATMRRLAHQYCSALNLHEPSVRLDAIAVFASASGYSIEHLKQVY